MVNPIASLILLTSLLFSDAQSVSPRPKELDILEIQKTQVLAACSYTVAIKTSCSSPRITRDKISLSFGDAYGNQIYVPRLDDPSSGTFERCATDTFKISGPCSYRICYLYLLRSGYDGWKPETVKVYKSNAQAVTFYYNTFVPNGVWFGFNLCNNDISSVVDGNGDLISEK